MSWFWYGSKSLASTEYADGVNEFLKAGFTAVPSDVVKPFRVKESVQFECKVNQIPLGSEGSWEFNLWSTANHINETVLDANAIDQHKIDLVSRLG
jgi:flavin reductase (DIM6/NTAB) family NADH-FMN oxidoreductase RutF